MSRKSLRNLAVLGGLGAAAYMAGKKSGESEAEGKKLPPPPEPAELPKQKPKVAIPETKDEPAAKPTPRKAQKDEGVTASGLPREARGVRAPTREFSTPKANEVPPAPAADSPLRKPAPKQKDEGVTASGLPREARGIQDTRTYREKWVDKQERAADKMREARRSQYGFKSGGKVSSASKRGDGIAIRGKTRCKVM